MSKIQNLLNEIDSIKIESNPLYLEHKMVLISEGLDLISNKLEKNNDSLSKSELIEILERVNWLTYETGADKAFEGRNLEEQLVKKSILLARIWLKDSKQILLKYLKMASLYYFNNEPIRNEIIKEITEISNLYKS